ncbi:MAG TPA: hypothetical protein VJ935_03085 [Acidimicrobiia bacterium]|nr:hypothetical protein [Acidimicrobiia bacterium]
MNYHLLSTLDTETNPDVKGLGKTVEAFPAMVVDGTYQDVRGHTYKLDQRLDIADLWNQAKRGRRLAAFRGPLLPFYTLVESLRNEVRQLASRVHR